MWRIIARSRNYRVVITKLEQSTICVPGFHSKHCIFSIFLMKLDTIHVYFPLLKKKKYYCILLNKKFHAINHVINQKFYHVTFPFEEINLWN